MHAINFVLEHPFAAAGLIIAALYAWSICRNRQKTAGQWNAKRVVRTFLPSAIVLLLVIAASTGLQDRLTRVDFGMFYSSALLLRQDPGLLYDPQVQIEYLHAVTGLEGEAHYLPFAYPPIVAFLFLPLTLLSFKSAYLVMLAANILLLILTLWWLFRKLEYQWDQRIALLVSASAALPLYAVLVLGHLTFLGLLLFALFVVDLMENRKWRTGIWAGLLLFKLTLFPVPLLILIWKRRWRAVGIFMLVAICMLLFSIYLVGWGGLRANAEMLFVMTSDYLLPRTQSLRGLVFSMGLGAWAWVVLAVGTVVSLCVALMKGKDQRWVLTGAMIAVMLAPPYLQFHDLSIGLIAIAIALTAIDPVTDKMRNYLFLIALVPGAMVLAIPRDGPSIPIMPVALLLLFIYSLWKAFHSSNQSFPINHPKD